MVREISKNEIEKFIDFGDGLYASDAYYVPYMRSDLKKELRRLVFEKRTYKALCSFDAQGKINGRVLLTVAKNKQLASDHCGYFSHFESVNDSGVFTALMDEAIRVLKAMGADHVVGPFYHHDPDNRRGILIEGFSYAPMLFTSHNPDYYQDLFESYGFCKLVDALEYEYKDNAENIQRIRAIAERSVKENDFRIDRFDPKRLDRDIGDVHTIMEIASTQINFEYVLSAEEIKSIFRKWKPFIDPDYAFIARRNSDDAPIGFTLSIPNYAELIRVMKGRLNLRGLLIFAFGRKRIRSIRAMLQYIVPAYQHKGVSKALYCKTKESVDKNGIERISLGTIMEENARSNGSITSLGGELSRRYRVYYKKIG